ncbi:MAG: hypothetical protein ACTSUV_04870 [Candidatus Ranarchaeia archaeon]
MYNRNMIAKYVIGFFLIFIIGFGVGSVFSSLNRVPVTCDNGVYIYLNFEEENTGINGTNDWIPDEVLDFPYSEVFAGVAEGDFETLGYIDGFPSRNDVDYWKSRVKSIDITNNYEFFIINGSLIFDVSWENITKSNTIESWSDFKNKTTIFPISPNIYEKDFYAILNGSSYETGIFNETTFEIPQNITNTFSWCVKVRYYISRRYKCGIWCAETFEKGSNMIIYFNTKKEATLIITNEETGMIYDYAII